MKRLTLALTAAFLLAGNALAHSPLKSTSPANEAVLNDVPNMLHFTFEKPARVVKVVMTHTHGNASHEVKLELPNKGMADELHLTPNFMGEGNYLIEWRALSEDGHSLKGNFSFKVEGDS